MSTATVEQGTVRGAVFAGPGKVEVRRLPSPRLASDSDVLIAIEACGICGTDLHILEDPPGHPARPGVVLGHEMVGRIIEAGSAATGVAMGDRVVVAPNLACGSCHNCKAGLLSACENYTTIGIFRDGGLCDRVSVPARACHRISDRLPSHIAALTEPLSCVLNGIQQAKPLPGEVAMIYGAGAIGLLFLAVLTAAGVRCVVVEPMNVRRETAQRMGAARVVDPTLRDPGAAVSELGTDRADLTVDAVGSQVAAALGATRPRGRVLLFGMNSQARAQIAQNAITRHELVVFGTYVGDFTFPAAVRLQESGLLNLEPVVSHRLPLERAAEAVAALREGDAVKVVLSVAGSPGTDA